MSLDDDAREFGQNFKQGGWRLGFLVARSTEPGKPGRPKAVENPSLEMVSDGKVSFTEFADLANVSQSQVSYHYAAWNLAAADDLCIHADQLAPDSDDGLRDDIEDDDEGVHTREQWLTYYRKARGSGSADGSPSQLGRGGKRSSSPSNSTMSETADSKAWKAVEALAKTSDQLSAKLVKVIDQPPLRGEEADLARFAEELRRTRSVLDRQCRDIDLVLDRIGYGDKEPAATAEA